MSKFRFGIIPLVLFFITACDFLSSENTDYLKQGVKHFEQGDYKAATIELKNAIQKNPEVADAYYYLALVEEKTRKFKAMQLNLQKVIELNPTHNDARVKLAKIYLLLGENDKAAEQIEDVLKRQPENTSALTVKAQILNRQKKNNEALALLDQVLNKKPGSIDALSMKAVIYIQQDDLEKALNYVDEGLKIDDKNIPLYLLKTRIHNKQKNKTAVIQDYLKLAALQPDNAAIKFALARAYFDQGEHDKAEKVLKDVIKKQPENFKARLVLLEFLSESGKRGIDEQLENFKESASANEKIMLAKWALSKNKSEWAEQTFKQIASSNENDVKSREDAYYQLALLKFKRQDLTGVEQDARKILALNPNNTDAKVLKAAVLIAQEKEDEAEKLLDNILWEQPDNDKAMVLLGRIFLKRGERDKAMQKFQQALKFNPANLQALMPVVQQEVSKQHLDYARELVQRAIVKTGPRLSLLQLLVKFDLAEKKWESADKIIKIIDQQKNGQLLAQFLHAKRLQAEGLYKPAIQAYQEILERYPWQNNSLQAMYQCYEEMQESHQMVRFLNKFIEKNPNQINAALLHARILAKEGKFEKAVSGLKRLLNNRQLPVIYHALALLYQQKGDSNEGLMIQKGLELDPNDIGLLMAKASYLERQNDLNEAAAIYRKILSINPGIDVVRNNLASLLLEIGGQENIEEAAVLTKNYKESEQPYFLDTYGWAQFKTGNISEARKVLEKVVLMAPDIPVFRYHLAKVYLQQGDRTKATGELREALALSNKHLFVEKKDAQNLLGEISRH